MNGFSFLMLLQRRQFIAVIENSKFKSGVTEFKLLQRARKKSYSLIRLTLSEKFMSSHHLFRLTPSECEHALLPNLEHATSVHSRVHHYQHPPNAPQPASPLSSAPSHSLGLSASLTSSTTNSSHETFDQTKNAIIYISVRLMSILL